MATLVRLGYPITRRVRRVNFIGNGYGTLVVEPHLVFRVDENQPLLGCDLSAACEQGKGDLLDLLPGLLLHETALKNLGA